MYKAILVPLDGSPLAERALPHAEKLAAEAGARLVLMRAARVPPFAAGDAAEVQLAVMDEAEEYLATLRAAYAERGIAVETAAPYGDPAQWIVDEVSLRGIDAIVMATHGRSGLSHLALGSVAESVLAHSPVPVLVIRAGSDDRAPAADPARVIVPLDGSTFAEAALAAAHDLAETIGAEVVLATTVIPPQAPVTDGFGHVISYVDQELEAQRAIAAAYLGGVAQRFAAEHGIPRPRTVVTVGDPATAMADVAAAEGAAYVVMSTHGRTGLRRALLGSVAGEVLRHGSTPLLLVRPAPARAKAAA
jgi:nucleotide-binding universal stress UspA family protein